MVCQNTLPAIDLIAPTSWLLYLTQWWWDPTPLCPTQLPASSLAVWCYCAATPSQQCCSKTVAHVAINLPSAQPPMPLGFSPLRYHPPLLQQDGGEGSAASGTRLPVRPGRRWPCCAVIQGWVSLVGGLCPHLCTKTLLGTLMMMFPNVGVACSFSLQWEGYSC